MFNVHVIFYIILGAKIFVLPTGKMRNLSKVIRTKIGEKL